MKSIINKIKHNHLLAMVLCCAIPVIGILALSYMGVLGSWGYYALLLVCPLGHILMMRGMHTDDRHTHSHSEVKEIDK